MKFVYICCSSIIILQRMVLLSSLSWSSSSPTSTLSPVQPSSPTSSSLPNTNIISDHHLAQIGSGWSHRTWSLLPKICCPGLQSPHSNCAPSLYPGDYFDLILMSGDHLILRLTWLVISQGRLRHGFHFTLKSIVKETAVTFVTEKVVLWIFSLQCQLWCYETLFGASKGGRHTRVPWKTLCSPGRLVTGDLQRNVSRILVGCSCYTWHSLVHIFRSLFLRAS